MKEQKNQEQFRKFLKFSTIGVQLGVMIYIASVIGAYIDTYYNLQKPLATMVFIIIALLLFMWSLIKKLENLNK